MTPTREQLRRWLGSFDEVHRVELEELRREGPRPGWSTSISLSMIQLAERAELPPAEDPSLTDKSLSVNDTWARLRGALRTES